MSYGKQIIVCCAIIPIIVFYVANEIVKQQREQERQELKTKCECRFDLLNPGDSCLLFGSEGK